MAKKIQVKQILELRAAGLSQNNIAKSRHMSKSSVSDVFQLVCNQDSCILSQSVPSSRFHSSERFGFCGIMCSIVY